MTSSYDHYDDDDDVVECICTHDDEGGGCDEDCPACIDFTPELAAVALRLMVAALDEDVDAIGIGLGELGECHHCERIVLLGVLKTVSRYGGPGLSEALRGELLELLDLVAEGQGL